MIRETEAEFASWVLDLLRLRGFRVAHFRPARTDKGWCTPVQADGAGWPDLVAVRGSRLLAVELKSARGRTTPEQDAWLAALGAAGCEVAVWRPDMRAAIIEALR